MGYTHPSEELLSREDGNGQCCAKTSEEWSALLDLMMSKSGTSTDATTAIPTLDPRDFSFATASAHLPLLPFGNAAEPSANGMPEFPSHGYTSLMLNTKTANSGMTHVHNIDAYPWGYHILHPGMYYVYSSIFYEPESDKPCRAFDKQTWEHVILVGRYNDLRNSRVEAKSVHTCCDDCIRTKDTSYVGRTIFLKTNDTISVQVSGTGLVKFNQQETFFGLYMISEAPVQDDLQDL